MMLLLFSRRVIPSLANMKKDEYQERNGGCSSSDKKETSETIYSKTTMIINRLSNDALEGGWDLLAG
jgi:hypothetical protein